jgi:hypothetical protein
MRRPASVSEPRRGSGWRGQNQSTSRRASLILFQLLIKIAEDRRDFP